MILTISDSEEGILNKIKSVLACESTLEVMEITNSEKLTFQGLEIDQLQRSKNLRKKIEENPEEPHYIETIRGVGYRFRA